MFLLFIAHYYDHFLIITLINISYSNPLCVVDIANSLTSERFHLKVFSGALNPFPLYVLMYRGNAVLFIGVYLSNHSY